MKDFSDLLNARSFSLLMLWWSSVSVTCMMIWFIYWNFGGNGTHSARSSNIC